MLDQTEGLAPRLWRPCCRRKQKAPDTRAAVIGAVPGLDDTLGVDVYGNGVQEYAVVHGSFLCPTCRQGGFSTVQAAGECCAKPTSTTPLLATQSGATTYPAGLVGGTYLPMAANAATTYSTTPMAVAAPAAVTYPTTPTATTAPAGTTGSWSCPTCRLGGFSTLESAAGHCSGAAPAVLRQASATAYSAPTTTYASAPTTYSAPTTTYAPAPTAYASVGFPVGGGGFRCPTCGQGGFPTISSAGNHCQTNASGTSYVPAPFEKKPFDDDAEKEDTKASPPPFPSEEKIKQARGRRMRKKSENIYSAGLARRGSADLRAGWADEIQTGEGVAAKRGRRSSAELRAEFAKLLVTNEGDAG